MLTFPIYIYIFQNFESLLSRSKCVCNSVPGTDSGETLLFRSSEVVHLDYKKFEVIF